MEAPLGLCMTPLPRYFPTVSFLLHTEPEQLQYRQVCAALLLNQYKITTMYSIHNKINKNFKKVYTCESHESIQMNIESAPKGDTVEL